MSFVAEVEPISKPEFTRPIDFLAPGVFQYKGIQPGQQAALRPAGCTDATPPSTFIDELRRRRRVFRLGELHHE